MIVSKKMFCFFILLGCVCNAKAQQKNKANAEQCGTMQKLDQQFLRYPAFKKQFEAERALFNNAVATGRFKAPAANLPQNGNKTSYTIPIVFHIVLPNPAVVSDAQILAQLDTLNRDFGGTNGDSVKIPGYFKSLFGASGIQFCMAKQTPSGQPSNGIDRVPTTIASFSNSDNDAVKHTATGGVDAWDPSSYFNVWVCMFSNGLLGYATFPGPGAGNDVLQGVAMEYRGLPGGIFTGFNGGKTLSHETGHYFNLYHIWGDDGTACTGTDYVDDTPNQAGATSGCYSGIHLDNCTSTGNGIMYQNYMDYSDDDCLVMFTPLQVVRMEAALLAYRASLLNSNGCQTPVQYNFDAQLQSISQPGQRICSSSFSPAVTIKNLGIQSLKSLTISSVLDNGSPVVYNWTGNLAQFTATDISLNANTSTTGTHTLKIYCSNPNNNTDGNPKNDTLVMSFQYNLPVSTIAESFEGNQFPPTGWDIVNPDFSNTWKKVFGTGKTGNASVMIDNFNYPSFGQVDYLRLPETSIPTGVDSAFFSFQVAAAIYTPKNTAGNNWDTLEVLLSTDCGKTYTSLYQKYGGTLTTLPDTLNSYFIPSSATQWRKDSINLGNYIGAGNILLAFRNSTGNENNIYLDDINLRTVSINPNLKKNGVLVTPNPTSGRVTVQFYPQPLTLKSIQIFSMAGQKIAETLTNGQVSNQYQFDIGRNAAGIYIVRLVMDGSVRNFKIVKD